MMRVTSFSWVLTVSSLLIGCGGAGHSWKDAAEQDDVAAYQAFVAAWPDHARTDDALARLDELRWIAAAQADVPEEYERYLLEHAAGLHVAEARIGLERTSWQQARDARSLDAVRAYLRGWPAGEHATEAAALEEELSWEAARDAGTVDAFGVYLARYPEGRFVAEAKLASDDAVFQEIAEIDTIDRYRWYLERHGDGAHVEEARARMEALLFSHIVLVVIGDDIGVERAVRPVLNEAGLTVRVVERSGPIAHPFDVVRPRSDQGLLVVTVKQELDHAYADLGTTVRLDASVELYAGSKREAVFRDQLTARSEFGAAAPAADAARTLREQLFTMPLPIASYVRAGDAL